VKTVLRVVAGVTAGQIRCGHGAPSGQFVPDVLAVD
jgi:hypothetical protein